MPKERKNQAASRNPTGPFSQGSTGVCRGSNSVGRMCVEGFHKKGKEGLGEISEDGK